MPETTAPVKVRQLGRTGITITPIGLGVMQFSGGTGIYRLLRPDIPEATRTGIIQAALEGGVNWFDTAEMYGNGRSERSLSDALSFLNQGDDDVVIATKWWPLPRTAGNIPRSIHTRLRHLSPLGIDLYQIHWPISFSSIDAQMNAMADLVEAGKIRAVGVSNYSAVQMRRAHQALARRGLPLASNQVQYNLLHRGIESNGVMETAKELGITIICWGPLASGLLTGRYQAEPDLLRQLPIGRRIPLSRGIARTRPLIAVLNKIATAHAVTVSQVALNWLVNAHGETVVAIPGASKPHHATESAGAMHFRLTEDEIARIDEVSR